MSTRSTRPPRLPSIRARLGSLVVAVALAGAALVALAVWLAVRHEVDELLDETLQASAAVLAGLLDAGDAQALAQGLPLAVAQAPRQEHFAWQLLGAGDRVLMRSARAPERPWLPLRTPGFADASSGWRVYGQPLSDGQRMLYVAQTHAERREAEAELVWAAVCSALALGVLGAWWLRRRARHELEPLAELSARLARYEPLQPGAALGPAAREELRAVQDAIEALGRRLAQRVANERAFSAHAAHALRTPLAGLDIQLAVLMREAPPALQPRLQRMREANGRLTRVVAALLALFRSGAEPQRRRLPLAPLLQRLPHEPLQIEVDAQAQVDADEDLLSAALINLLDNALRHGARQVRLQLHGDGTRQQLRVHDDGRGADAARRAVLAVALDTQRYEGRTGLGLMLADLVARAHGGRLHLPDVDQGFAVDIDLGPAPHAEQSTR